MVTLRKTLRVLMMILTIATIGCGDHADSRVEQVMQESLKRQAEQNQQVSEQSRLSAESVQRVVEAESAARTEVVELQRDMVERDKEGREQLLNLTESTQNNLNAERVVLDRQRSDLERERQQLAIERRRDPIIAQTIAVVGMLAICAIPLFLAGYVLYSVSCGNDDEDVINEILIGEVTAQCPAFLIEENPRLPIQNSDEQPPAPDADSH